MSDDPSLQRLVASSKTRIAAALTALPDDQDAVSINALIGLEHLTKASLWSRSPTLLIPLTASSEASLLLLATSPDLLNPKLRTIGLQVALDRLAGLLPKLPVAKEARQRLAQVRNGYVHVGTAKASMATLSETLTLVDTLLDDLDITRESFFGDYLNLADRLVDDRATELSRDVALKLINAKRRLEDLRTRLGQHAYDELLGTLESRAEEDVPMDSTMFELHSLPNRCPVCGYDGRLIGIIDVDVHYDADVEPLGGGEYETVEHAFNTLSFDPVAFGCNVCALYLGGFPELQEANISVDARQVEEDDVHPPFDMNAWNEAYAYEGP